MNKAWAVVDDDFIFANSIYSTRLGAIRNWLCTEKGIMLTNISYDIDAEYLWRQLKGGCEAKEIILQVLE